MTLTVTMNAPAGFGGEITGTKSGTTYGVPSNGIVTGVLLDDIPTFLALGFQMSPNTILNLGTPATGVTAAEFGDGYNHSTVLTLNTVLPAIAGGAALGVGVLLYTLPAGAEIITAAKMAVAITQTQGHITADTPTVGLGTVIASGAVSVLSGTATFQNIGVGKAAADCNGTPTAQTALATSSPFGLVTETGGTKTVYFNAANSWAASGDAAAKVTGSVVLNWRYMG